MKAFAKDNINVTKNLRFALKGVENILGKGHNAYQHLLLLQQCFQKASFSELSKVRLCDKS